MPELAAIRALEEQYLLPTYARIPLLLVRGKGVHVFDSEGKRYLDCITGIGVNAMGHAHPRILAAMREQARKLIHTSNLYFNEYQGPLAQRLTALSGMERAFFTVSGAEAAEGAIKIARALGQRLAPEKIELVALEHSFHGRTMGALSVTGQLKYRAPFGPLLAGVHFVRAGDQAALAAAVSDRTAGVLIEPVQGEGGIRQVPPDFLAMAAALARQHHACLIFDEIQCGLGRTGKPFAHQWTSLVPDVVITAKPIAAGYPLGAILARGEAATALNAGSHGTTFGGGPLACRLGLEFLDFLEQPATLENVRNQGAALLEGARALARKHAFIKEVRGMGLMLGLELDRPAAPVVRRLLELGLLANVTHDTIIRLLPPYILEDKHTALILRALAKALKTTDYST
ncbi:MAG: aspartate aminotransferase family protein [Terriglobales bacterium]